MPGTQEAESSLAASTTGRRKLRFITAASLFDGHDASINVIRRLLLRHGCEVIHLGHNRSVDEILTAALDEDAHAIAVSSYQGGHMEFFRYMVDRLRERDAPDIRVFAGGGGVILPHEINLLQEYGIARVYSPNDGQVLGLDGMVQDMLQRADHALESRSADLLPGVCAGDRRKLARTITLIERGEFDTSLFAEHHLRHVPVLGVTGTGGAGKSSITDEIIRSLRIDQQDEISIAVLAVDPGRRRFGGALLGDRIRMNAISARPNATPVVYMRSLAMHEPTGELPRCIPDVVTACSAAGFELIILETVGIGQHDASVAQVADVSLYVMTPEFGAATQLEKIDMLDFADAVAINKFDRRGAQDALREVRKQMQRNRDAFAHRPEDMPVFGTIASRFNDDGTTALYHDLRGKLAAKGLVLGESRIGNLSGKTATRVDQFVPVARQQYLAEIAQTVRDYKRHAREQAQLARDYEHLHESALLLRELEQAPPSAVAALDLAAEKHRSRTDPACTRLLREWSELRNTYSGTEYSYNVRGREIRVPLFRASLSGTAIPRVSLPRFHDAGDRLEWLMLENVPGQFPYTAGVFPFRREDEEPTRMFAGEGSPKRTNARFHYLAKGQPAIRLSTAFDAVTLYGEDPHERPDIFGKIGNSGVSVATLDDMRDLYSGFDLCDPSTSVSMTINGPAPTVLAMFLNVAIDQQKESFVAQSGREPAESEWRDIRARVLSTVRGTVQADILKEDQAQNTCIFSTAFSLRCMSDIQEYFIRNRVKNFYSVSVSGYHMAEAGANPINQLAFTLANGFTLVEAYLARGMRVDEFASNFSFFFSNGMDPEYSVVGRVARRIWAIAMRNKYGADKRSQLLKYHIQTSGRSLHAQEMEFNDVRTTLQALAAIYDNCNSLHTNAFDEAISTPTDESVRKALAIQLIINREWGVASYENPNQGSFFIEQLTDLVEEAVLTEFERISDRGGVLGAMESGYQRSRIQEDSLRYEQLKHSGEYPIIGVNTFQHPDSAQPESEFSGKVSRSSVEERTEQIQRLRVFQSVHSTESGGMLERLKDTAMKGGNVFEVLMDAVRCCSLGQITETLFQAGGQYRRSM